MKNQSRSSSVNTLKIVIGDYSSKLLRFPGRQHGRRDHMNLVISITLKNVTQAFMYLLTSKCPYIGPFYLAYNKDAYN